MTTLTIEQIKTSEHLITDKSPLAVPRIEGVVGRLYERKTGTGQFGEWSFQNSIISDPTGDMKLVFKNLPDQKKLEGKKLIFKSMEGKHGLRGVEAKKNEYQGKTTLELHVSKAALIVGGEEEDRVSTVTPSTRMPQNEPVEAPQAPIRHEDRKLGIATAKNRLTQLAGLYDLCWETVGHMKVYEDTEGGMELHKDVATTLFIAAQREGLAEKMPVRTLSKFYGNPEGEDNELENGHEDEEILF